MLSRDEGSKFLHRLCRHCFFCEVVSPVGNNSADEEDVSVGVCFCTAQREAATAVVSIEPPDDVAGGEAGQIYWWS